MHDDLQMMRQLQMEKCFLDGQIPCRWVPDMGYGFGLPLFNFYPPLPYLMGQAIRVIGYSFVTTVKLTFALSFIVSGITMYLLAKEFFGRLGGVLSSIFYIWAPYHAVDVYVRGAMNEAWALVWFPLIFWGGYRLVISKKQEGIRWIILLALAWFALLTSHNLMVLIFAPFFGLWILLHLWRENAWHKIPQLLISGVWAFGLAAFFSLPVLFERNLIDVSRLTQGYFEYQAHFVSIRQLLFSRFWGYGVSAWGVENDGMSFQVGHILWGLSLVVGIILVIKVIRGIRKIKDLKKDRLLFVTGFLLLVGWFSAFMAHSHSTPIWLAIEPLRFVQFPWRFLTIVIFAFSFIVGSLALVFRSKRRFFDYAFAPLRMTMTSLLIILLVVFNWNYFRPHSGRMGLLTDEEKFSGLAWRLQQKGGYNDYLPRTAKETPNSPQVGVAEVLEGKGSITKASQGTNWAKFDANIESEEAQVRINIFYFPNWKVFVDGDEIGTFIPEDEKLGRMNISLGQGEHLVYAQLFNTPVRTWSNIISIFSWFVVIGISLSLFRIVKRK
ncbi:hypothetical protein IID22_01915 [Patescibacteria group bacterium]|nr:hypothetical protein [Patescibacteria group bacterium]